MNALEQYMHDKGLEYNKFNPNRVKNLYAKLQNHLPPNPKTIQIIGTNGKGSTGRFLCLALMQAGFKVLHFTSPHIFRFNERFYKNGEIVSDEELLLAHDKLQAFDFITEASYFEYATFLACVLAESLDFLILEAGVGGEFDSTSVVRRDLCLFSMIDFDHEDLLGNSIEKIATTKLNAMVSPSILGFQTHSIVYEIASKIASMKHIKELYRVDSINSDIMRYVERYSLASFLGQNLALSVKALEVLGIKVDINLLPCLDLMGRFQRIKDNIIIDVGHNPSAALAIKSNLKDKQVVLVYNSYFQKNTEEILRILKDNILRVEIIALDNNPRVIQKDALIMILEKLNLPYSDFVRINPLESYLVFGSFSVVEKFMRDTFGEYNDREQ